MTKPLVPDSSPPAAPARVPSTAAALSLLVPGLGQLTQRRPAAALIQFGTVAGYVAVALGTGGSRAVWLAVLWNAWSAADAYWHVRRLSRD